MRPGPPPGTAQRGSPRDTVQTKPNVQRGLSAWTHEHVKELRVRVLGSASVGRADAPLPCQPGAFTPGQMSSRSVDVVVKSLERDRGRTGELCGWHLRRKAKVAQDAANHTHILDERNQP